MIPTHTKGPWEIKPWDGYERIAVRATVTNPLTGCDNWKELLNVQSIPDARLIAAAPDLLEALIEIDQYLQGCAGCCYPTGLFDVVQSAIAKARGE